MKKVLLVAILALFASLFGELKLGYINADKIMTEYSEAKKAQEDLRKWNMEKEKEAMKLQEEIKKLEEELKNMSMMLSDDKKREKMENGQKKLIEYQQFKESIWGAQGEFYKQSELLNKPVLDKINLAIKKVSEDNGYDFVFDATNGSLVYSKSDYDITDKVLLELNK
ncbi:MAG: hypothetical protein CR982_09490 [Candidatus Cloacimonadota bacterium]|nr:MAG: hypothetical protein CR982_09490 [Candidatus Cloacimonadota bacterium]PIE79272.1 MAG: hypothetical protein CSA15_03665 [Candidatus Delongbacteria bacterium]